MFQRVSEAWEALSDIEKRAIYDHELRQRWKEEERRKRDVCDKGWFSQAMHDPHVEVHEHSETFSDKEFDEYVSFMKGQMGL